MDVAKELGLISNSSSDHLGFERHPLAYLVEAADDICYTIIDFEDGINLGLVPEEFALEYLIKLVKNNIDTAKYQALTTKQDRVSYLRALAIGSLIQDAVKVFIENESAILEGKFPFSLMDKSQYKAQMDDIIQLSVKNIYQSREVVEKEIKGYHIIHQLIDTFATAYIRFCEEQMTTYDNLIIKILPENYHVKKYTPYDQLMHICQFVSMLTDGNALLYAKLIQSSEV
jgi:dGTPase